MRGELREIFDACTGWLGGDVGAEFRGRHGLLGRVPWDKAPANTLNPVENVTLTKQITNQINLKK